MTLPKVVVVSSIMFLFGRSTDTCRVYSPSFSLERLVFRLLKHLSARFGDAIDADDIALHVLGKLARRSRSIQDV